MKIVKNIKWKDKEEINIKKNDILLCCSHCFQIPISWLVRWRPLYLDLVMDKQFADVRTHLWKFYMTYSIWVVKTFVLTFLTELDTKIHSTSGWSRIVSSLTVQQEIEQFSTILRPTSIRTDIAEIENEWQNRGIISSSIAGVLVLLYLFMQSNSMEFWKLFDYSFFLL